MTQNFVKKSNKIYLVEETEVKLSDLEAQKDNLEEQKQRKIELITEEFDKQIADIQEKINSIKEL